jgi:putative tryptophan/tyrosine transport system substrate-binding protein
MMRRREFMAAIGSAAAWPMAGRAAETPRIGLLTLQGPDDPGERVGSFVSGLRSLGYIEHQTVYIDYRYASGDTKILRSLAQELIALKPNVLFGGEPSAARALKIVSSSLPIVCPTLSEALIPELAASYARPGGNVTGIAASVEGMIGKLLELATEVCPGIVRIGFLSNPAGASMQLFARKIDEVAGARGIKVLTEEARTRDDLDSAFDQLAKQRVEAVLVPANALFVNQHTRIAQLALANHLPTIFPERADVEVGGLASYGVDQRETYGRAASYVDRILKGASPGDLPIEFPTKLELAVNLRTAKALDIDIPATLLVRADEVIE